jgi:ATP-dependent protease HslVU (ClpYQ) peptidase subunit
MPYDRSNAVTVIIGIKTEAGVIVGGDSLSTIEDGPLTTHLRSEPKLFQNGKYIIGIQGRYRLAQILRFAELPTPDPVLDPEEADKWMVKILLPGLRDTFKAEEFTQFTDTEHLLIAWGRHLYAVYPRDWQFRRMAAGYEAIGCAAPFAMGAMHATADLEISDRERLSRALLAAEEFSGTVRAPFVILWTT